MKQSIKIQISKCLLICLALFQSMVIFAQDSSAVTTTKSTSSTTTTNWYMQPWAWVAGGVVLLVLLIAMFSGRSSRSEKIIITKTRSVE